MRKICVVTGSRAEYGLLKALLKKIYSSKVLELQLVVTGSHLSYEHGHTIDEIVKDGFIISHKVEMLLSSDTNVGVSKSMGLAMISFADVLHNLQPDMLMLLGDRFEIFSAATTGLILGIPIAHIHGGEKTEGAYDDAIRHSITKMSNLHFVASECYAKRVIQLGEAPDTVFNVGGLGVEAIKNENLLTKDQLINQLGIDSYKRNLVITYHPATLENQNTLEDVNQLLAALSDLREVGLIFTNPNADNEGRGIEKLLRNFCNNNSNAYFFSSLGSQKYYSCLKHFDGVVGNSSSGLLEAPTFQTGTVNIGNRQNGRLQAESIINCTPEKNDIASALDKLLSTEFRDGLRYVVNPYGEGKSSDMILKVLEGRNFISRKSFFDLQFLD